jgi:hypothetical protein
VYYVSTVFRLTQNRRVGEQLDFYISRHIAHIGWETPVCFFYTFYLVYIWHSCIKLFLRHLPNCPCSNFSRYVDLFTEISPRIAKQLWFHHLRRSVRTITLGFFKNGIPAMKNPDALRIFFPEIFGGKYKLLKKHNSRRIIS